MIEEEDWNMLRLLWFNGVQGTKPEIVQYRFCRLVFGLTPSPAILQGVIQHHLSRQKTSDPVVIELLSNTLYVDDFPEGADDVKKGYHLYCESKDIMKILIFVNGEPMIPCYNRRLIGRRGISQPVNQQTSP